VIRSLCQPFCEKTIHRQPLFVFRHLKYTSPSFATLDGKIDSWVSEYISRLLSQKSSSHTQTHTLVNMPSDNTFLRELAPIENLYRVMGGLNFTEEFSNNRYRVRIKLISWSTLYSLPVWVLQALIFCSALNSAVQVISNKWILMRTKLTKEFLREVIWRCGREQKTPRLDFPGAYFWPLRRSTFGTISTRQSETRSSTLVLLWGKCKSQFCPFVFKALYFILSHTLQEIFASNT